jgi:alcohol dehydrogenase, propanol-preferring
MRALQLTKPSVLEIVEVDDPVPGPGEVVVRVAGAGLCHSDLHVLHLPFEVFPLPLTLGHEVAGHVESIGSGVTAWAGGDAVLVHLAWSCGVCRQCIAGRDNACAAFGRHGTPPAPGLGPHGGMADKIVVPARHLVAIDGLDPVTSAPLADAGLTPYHAIAAELDRLVPGSTAVAIGVGGLGHMGVQLLEAMTAATVIAVDLDQAKLDVARRLGAEHALVSDSSTAAAVLDLTGGYGADVVLDFTGVEATLALATATVAPTGAIRIVGLGGGSITYPAGGDPFALPWGVSITRAYGGTRRDVDEVVALARAGRIHVEVEQHPLADGVEVFERLERGEVQGRAVLVP